MLILSVDSAGGSCGACVWRDGTVLAATEETMERGQDQRLMPLILEIMKKANIGFEALDRIAVTRGPGSFTGLRIGLATARGMGLAAGKPVIGINRFSIFHEQAKTPGKNLFVIINSKRKELFCRFYPAQGEPHEATMLVPDEILVFLKDKPDIVVTGDMSLSGLSHFQKPEEKEITTCAALAARAKADDAAFLPRPLYLRAPDVTLPKTAAS
ncbi:MAG: tRNA (adenosine(37)-N6)-threonylcarbamoyltransferase complex dimerization subunit type 1 TsaB [Alphaproteobacteria bacterium]|nr:tRNA (adenosine(37)-N6)-threonylcarbamoyltransferase complex dimerization subunit type 1 TsaB [Alphaproteobacteria bacterium]